MKLPRKKKIKGNIWRILEIDQPIDDDMEPCWGLCDYVNRIIYIKKKLSKDSKLATYLHEVLHASLHEIALDLGHKEDERVVLELEKILLGLFKIVPR